MHYLAWVIGMVTYPVGWQGFGPESIGPWNVTIAITFDPDAQDGIALDHWCMNDEPYYRSGCDRSCEEA